ncbi:hypothetical protein [Anaerotignum propionicum]|uniref:hypothetical protein n=1 Tax=Anaerotignum propionicum TaxID=28446 RepID=UPI00289CD4FB|nr:hypothetical protein [Anaerotignum propionicum]
MNRFEKRSTLKEIEIFGNTYNVDFGRDELPLIFQEVSDEFKSLKTKDYNATIQKQKQIYKNAINKIIGDEKASDQIFKDDDSAILHNDIYGFLFSQFNEVMADESPYSPKRIK